MNTETCSNQQYYLHIVRNPYGHTDEEVRTARLYVADALEAAWTEVDRLKACVSHMQKGNA